MRKLGQHFLNNKAVVKKIVGAIDVHKGDAVLEIGPGRGALTLTLAAACVEAGATLTVIEKDATLAAALVKIIPDVNVITGDALKELPRIATSSGSSGNDKGDEPLTAVPTKLVGNLPYYITGHLFRIIGELEEKPEKCVFMIQREVAERLTAKPPRMNRLAASVQFWADISIIAAVSRQDFSPPPEVDSAVIVLEVKKEQKSQGNASKNASVAEHYYSAVRAIFAQPRKTLLNNLAAALRDHSKEDLVRELAGLAIKPDARPQDVGREEIARIAETFF